MSESYTHGKYARTDTSIIRYLIANDGTLGSIHNEPDISFDSTNLYVGFICGKYVGSLIIIVVNERLYDKSSSSAIVSYLLMRDADVVKILEGIFRLPEREPQVHMHGQTKRHDVRVMLREL